MAGGMPSGRVPSGGSSARVTRATRPKSSRNGPRASHSARVQLTAGPCSSRVNRMAVSPEKEGTGGREVVEL